MSTTDNTPNGSATTNLWSFPVGQQQAHYPTSTQPVPVVFNPHHPHAQHQSFVPFQQHPHYQQQPTTHHHQQYVPHQQQQSNHHNANQQQLSPSAPSAQQPQQHQQPQLQAMMVYGPNGQPQMVAVDPTTGTLIPLQAISGHPSQQHHHHAMANPQPLMPPPSQQPQIVMLPNGQFVALPPTTSPQQAQLHQHQPPPFLGGLPHHQQVPGLVSMIDPSAIPPFPNVSASSGFSPGNSSAHISPNASLSTRAPCDTSRWGYAVVDPYHTALQRVPIPPHVVAITKGVINYNADVQNSSTKPCTSNVCVKYVSEFGCSLGDDCLNFHVKQDYIARARKVLEPLCCGIHNDYFTQEMIKGGLPQNLVNCRFVVVLEDRSEVDILPSQLSFTTGLDNLACRSNTRTIQLKKHVCRLHLEGRCKWTKDCGHVHLCREFISFLGRFHYPSLLFLLQTETNATKLSQKLSEPTYELFLRSKSVLPLIIHLLNGKNRVAIEQLLLAGAKVTPVVAKKLQEACELEVSKECLIEELDCPL